MWTFANVYIQSTSLHLYVVYYIHDSEYDNTFARSKCNMQTPSHNYKSLPVQYIYHVHKLCSTFLLFLEHQRFVDPVQQTSITPGVLKVYHTFSSCIMKW